MGCGCGGGKKSLGSTPAGPLVFGEDNASLPTRRVILLQGSGGAPAGATRYVRGTEVEDALVDGRLRAADKS